MAIEKFVVSNPDGAMLHSSKGSPLGTKVPHLTNLECNWRWTYGDLEGKRKIESVEGNTVHDWVGRFVNDSDLQPGTIEPPPPTGDVLTILPGKIQIEGVLPDGTVKVFQNTDTIVLPEAQG